MSSRADNPLWQDIQAQGDNLRRVVAHLYGPEYPRLQAAARFLRGARPLVLTGMGSAAYLCMPAEAYLGEHGHFASVIYTSEALYTRFKLLSKAKVLINSRSGETVEVVRLAHALQEAGLPFLAVTNEPESSLAKMATHVLWCNSRQDDLVSANIVTGMLAATLALAAETLGRGAAARRDLERLAPALDETLRQATRRADELAGHLQDVRALYLLYRGASKGAAYCGRLVLEEVARRAAVPVELGEFRQGPIEVAGPGFGAVVFVPDGEPGRQALILAGQLQAAGGRLLAIGGPPGQAGGPGFLAFPLPAAPPYLRPLLEVIPMQLLAYALAEAQGYPPGTVRYLPKVITSETEIPNLPPGEADLDRPAGETD